MAKGKSKTGLFIIIGCVVLLLAGGGFVGAAVLGKIKVPGLTPKKFLTANLYGEGTGMYGESSDLNVKVEDKSNADDTKVAENKTDTPSATDPAPKKPEPPKPTIDPEAGAKKIAKVWNDIKADQLALIAQEYKEADLALILSKMESDKAAKLLGTLDPKRAAKVSKEMQALGSVVPPPAS